MKKIFLLIILAALCTELSVAQTNYNNQPVDQNGVILKKKKIHEKSDRQSGFQQKLEVGVGIDYKDWQTATLDASYIYGYQAGHMFFFGVGGGLQFQPIFFDYYLADKYKLNRPFTVSMPLFLEIKTYILNRKVSPFIDIRGGYNINLLKSKMTYKNEFTYGGTNDLSSRTDYYTKNWSYNGKFAAGGVGVSYKKWEAGIYYMPWTYGKYEYSTLINYYYDNGDKKTESFNSKYKNKKYPINLQLKVSYRF